MNSFLTVVRFTFLNRVRSRPFIISSVLFVLLITLGINLPNLIDRFSSGKATAIGMIDDQSGIGKALQAYFQGQDKPEYEVDLVQTAGSNEADEKQLSGMLKEKRIKGYLELVPSQDGGFPNAVYKAEKVLSSGKKEKLTEALRLIKTDFNSKSSGLSQEQLGKLFGPVTVDSVQLSAAGGQAGKTEAERNTAFALVYALLFLIFMIVMMYGNLIATEITAEKSSRVMEILITSVSPLKQMFGKITGTFLLGLSQILLFLATGTINLLASAENRAAIEKLGLSLSGIQTSLIVYFILFFVLGFFLYATLLAAVGSLVSRTEDLGQAIMPVTMLALAGFYISIYGLNNPSSAFVTVMSYVPFFTPMLMFLRIGMIGAAPWEIVLSLCVLLVAIFVLGWIASKIYRVGVLMYGKRPSMKEVFKAMKAMKV